MTAIFKYHGSKWRMAPWIIKNMPAHKCYVEPFGGSAAVLMHKPSVMTEIYNDLDDEVVNVFKVIREHPEKFCEMIALTPYSRVEMAAAYLPTSDPVEAARRFLVRSQLAISTTSLQEKTGFRAHINSKDYCSQPATWSRLPASIMAVRARFNKVIIENIDAFKLFERYDLPDTLWYLDPPYMKISRTNASNRRGYKHDLSDTDQERLLGIVLKLKGKVMLSSYKNDLYDSALEGWHQLHRRGFTDSRNRTKSVETLYLNYEPLNLLFK